MAHNPRPKDMEKRMKIAEQKVHKIINKIEHFKLNDYNVSRLILGNSNDAKNRVKRFSKQKVFATLLCVLCGVFYWVFTAISSEKCLIELPSITKSVFRPPEDCDACAGVSGVTRVHNISTKEFELDFAYSTYPLIVTDAAKDWKAVTNFNYEFFKQFYSNGKLGQQINDCFYFAYKSGLNSLNEVFNMEEARSNLSGAPWYVGWSTCFDEEVRQLRSYYNRPYFLPASSESDMVDWIFMGGPGQGAHMHIDSVRHMSWQAQVRGRKRWSLAPAPECLYACKWFDFVVETGEILVVNTNRWFHKTTVLPGDISITIGAEYD